MLKLVSIFILFSINVFAAQDCYTKTYQMTRSGFGQGYNDHPESHEVAIKVCSGKMNLDDYLKTRQSIINPEGMNSHFQSMEAALAAKQGVILFSDYIATLATESTMDIMNSHEEALETAKLVKANDIKLSDYLEVRSERTHKEAYFHAYYKEYYRGLYCQAIF